MGVINRERCTTDHIKIFSFIILKNAKKSVKKSLHRCFLPFCTLGIIEID